MKKKHWEWLNSYLDNCELLNKSEHTIKNYAADLTKFINWYELTNTVLLSKASSETISMYREYLVRGKNLIPKPKVFSRILALFKKKESVHPSRDPMAVSSVKRHLSSIKNFFEYLNQKYDTENIFKNNPVKSKIHQVKLKDIDIHHTEMLTSTDWQKINKTIYRIRDKLIVNILYWGGLRISELTKLKKSDFDINTKTMKFARKGGSIHTLIIQNKDTIFNLYDRYLNTYINDSKYLFINRQGKNLTPRSMYNIIMNILRKSGCVNVTPHSFRKACATKLYLKTKDLLLVRDYLNHSDATVTQTYIDRRILGYTNLLREANNQ